MKRYMGSHGILSEHDLMFEGPQGRMTLLEAQQAGYDVDVRGYSHQGMVLPMPAIVQRDLGAGLSLYELENRNQRDYERRLAAQMQNAPVVQMQALTRNERTRTAHARGRMSDAQILGLLYDNQAWDRFMGREAGGLEAGPAKHMGVPCEMPRPGWRERLRQWRRR